MRIITGAAALLAAAVTLSACDPFDGFRPVIEGGEAEATETPRSIAQSIGDELFGPAASIEVRQARQDLLVAGYFFMLADRVTRFDAEIAGDALIRMEDLRAAMREAHAAGNSVFAELIMGQASLELAAVFLDTGIERGGRLAALVAGGLNPSALLSRGRVAARQAVQAQTLQALITAAVARMNEEPAYVAEATAAAEELMCTSQNRLLAMRGAPPLICGGGDTPV